MLTAILILNVLFIGFLILTGSSKNIESRTEREEKILKNNK
jgi:hypothetical protein